MEGSCVFPSTLVAGHKMQPAKKNPPDARLWVGYKVASKQDHAGGEAMNDSSMNRKEFLSNMGKVCVGACVCAAAGGLSSLQAEETASSSGS